MKDWLKHGQGAKHCFPLKFTVCAVTSSKEFCHLLPNNGTPLAPCYLACPSRWEHVTTNTKALIHRRGILSSPAFSLVREPTTTSSLAAISGRRRKNESLLPPQSSPGRDWRGRRSLFSLSGWTWMVGARHVRSTKSPVPRASDVINEALIATVRGPCFVFPLDPLSSFAT